MRSRIPPGPQAQGATAPPARRGGWGWMRISAAVLLATPLLAVLFPSAVLLGVLMLPTLVAVIVDRRPEKHAAIAVGLLNFCGTLPALADLWSRGQMIGNSLLLLGESMTWLTAFGAAGLGWLLVLLATPMAHTYLTLTTQGRLRVLQRQQQRLVEEWGEAVALQDPGLGLSEEEAAQG